MGEGWIDAGPLRLRKLAEGDLDDLVALDADPDVMRFINGGQPTPRETYVDGVLARMLAYDHPRIGFFAAVSSEGDAAGRFLGWFHLRPSVAPAAGADTLELGYRLRREAWGRGLATAGGRALCRVAFDELGMAVVDACAMPENTASIAVMRKCGMTWRGRFRHPRAPIDVEHYATDRAAFEAATRQP